MIDKLLNILDKFNIKRASELVNNKTLQSSGDLLYSLESIILPEYQHVKTPFPVEEFLETIKGMPLQVAYYTSDNLKFCKDSLAYSKRQETQEEPVKPSNRNSYRPLFDTLDKVQKEWYFYWRKEVLRGNYLNTEASYVFIFVYELLNYTFNANAAFNLSMLDRIYLNYQDKDYELNYLLPRWISDFCYELGDYELEAKWSTKIRNHELSDYETLKQFENKLGTVSITFWKRFIRYNKTAFFKTNRNLIYKAFKTSIALLEREYQAQGENLIEAWMPLHEGVSFERQLFSKAVIGRNVENKLEAKRFPSLKMRNDLSALFNLAKNIARVKAGEKRQLNVDETLFPEGFKNALMELFQDKVHSIQAPGSRFTKTPHKGSVGMGSSIPEPPDITVQEIAPTPLIEFDLERIDTLDKESKELLEIFALRYDEDVYVDHYDKPDLKNGNNSLETLINSREEIENEIHSDSLIPVSAGDEFETFIAKLTTLEAAFLLGFKDYIRDKQEGKTYLKAHGIMMGLFISTLNEKSLDCLGDNLIEQEGDILRFNEDFEQVLHRLAEEE